MLDLIISYINFSIFYIFNPLPQPADIFIANTLIFLPQPAGVVEILLFWIFLPTGLWKFCCSGYFCRLDCGNSVALDISTGWIVEILLLWIFLPTGYGNSVALDISAGWGVEILLLIKIFDRLGDLIYMFL